MLKLLSVSVSDAPSTPPHAPPPFTAPALSARNATAVNLSAMSPLLLSHARVAYRSKFTAENFLILIRKFFAARAHAALQGETRKRFEVEAPIANVCRKHSFAATKKSAQIAKKS